VVVVHLASIALSVSEGYNALDILAGNSRHFVGVSNPFWLVSM
jgi:hypothetical protein